MQAEPGGPTLWHLWGEMKQGFGELRSLTLGNRQAMIDHVSSVQRRQDDMRLETLYHISRIDRMLAERRKSTRTPLRWVMHLPWDRIVGLLAAVLGVLGYLRPEWVKLITAFTGGH